MRTRRWMLQEESSARVAQLVEHTLGKGEVIGSIPIASLPATVFEKCSLLVPTRRGIDLKFRSGD
jgi:hypothetical protein